MSGQVYGEGGEVHVYSNDEELTEQLLCICFKNGVDKCQRVNAVTVSSQVVVSSSSVEILYSTPASDYSAS